MGRITLHVQPGASTERVAGRHGEKWKIAVAAPPVDGRANQACIEFLARLTGAPKSAVELIRGAGGRLKTFEIDGVSAEEVERKLKEASSP